MAQQQGRTEISSLTGMRGLAALWVIGFHCHTLLPSHPLPEKPFGWGYLGVDVFFVLSGYMLASLYPRLDIAAGGTFFLRRVCRIYPLHLAIMACLGLIACLASLRWAHTPYYSPDTFLPVLSLLQVPLGRTGWNDPAWSISVEMICYLSLPLALPVIATIGGRRCAAIATALLCCDASLLAIAGPQGVLDSVPQLSGWFPIVRGALGFYAGCCASRVLALRCFESRAWAPLCWRPIVFVGEISFSLYLIHQPILSLGKRLDPILAGHSASVLLLPCLGCIVLALSILTYRCIEQPGRGIPGIIARRRAARVLAVREATGTMGDVPAHGS